MRQSLLVAAAVTLTIYGNVSSELLALGNAISLHWTYTATNITFTLVANTTGWAAIGFSPHGEMEGSDIAMLVVKNGQVTVQDRYATGRSLPEMDNQQDYKLLSGTFVNGQLNATFSRLLDTCDPHDAIIKSFSTRIILAYGALDRSGVPQYHGSTQRASISRHLLSEEPAPPSDSGIFLINPVPRNILIRNSSDTIYWCSLVQLPQLENKTHIIEMRPIIMPGNEDIVHHMLVYMCDVNVNTSVSSFICFDGSDQWNQENCRTLIGAWAIGGTNFRFPSNVGLPLEGGTTAKYILIQTHYNIMGNFSGRVDSSYISFVATQTLRPIDAGILDTGIVNGMLMPPNADQTLVSGYCSSDCLSSSVLPSTGINAFAVALHSHLLGRRIALRHFRPSQNITLPVIADDPSYDFEYQEAIYLDSPRLILPGDVLQTVCLMNSSARNVATQGGPGTMQEMCVSFIFYYPKVDLKECLTIPSWVLNSSHQMYEQLGKNFSSFNWLAGINDGLDGANWSTALIQTLQKGYTLDANLFYCRINQTDALNIFVPPVSSSSMLQRDTGYRQKCQSQIGSNSTATTTGTSSAGTCRDCSMGAHLVLAIVTIAKTRSYYLEIHSSH